MTAQFISATATAAAAATATATAAALLLLHDLHETLPPNVA